jgi:hypothetical protein
MTSLLGIIICAALFALFAVVRPRGCTGHCTGCTSACERHEGEGDHHVG